MAVPIVKNIEVKKTTSELMTDIIESQRRQLQKTEASLRRLELQAKQLIEEVQKQQESL